jgi:hypothetical protein
MTIRPLVRYFNLGGSFNTRGGPGEVARSPSTEHLEGEVQKSEVIHLPEGRV